MRFPNRKLLPFLTKEAAILLLNLGGEPEENEEQKVKKEDGDAVWWWGWMKSTKFKGKNEEEKLEEGHFKKLKRNGNQMKKWKDMEE